MLEDDIWLGAKVKVLAAIRMGTGSIAAAGAVICKDVPPHPLARQPKPL